MHDGPFVRGRVYAGGNLREFEERARSRGAEMLYIGDHIYGDMLRSRKSSAWRTAMVLQELEHEVEVHDRLTPELLRLDELERQLRHLDAEISDKQMVLRALQRKDEAHADALDALGPVELSAAKRTVKEALDHLRAELRTSMVEHQQLEQSLDAGVQPPLGPAVPRGPRDQQVRRAGRGLRLRLHQPVSQLPLLLAEPPLPRPARPHAARALG